MLLIRMVDREVKKVKKKTGEKDKEFCLKNRCISSICGDYDIDRLISLLIFWFLKENICGNKLFDFKRNKCGENYGK